MEVAVLDSNKKVLNTISVKKNQCQNASNDFEIAATTTNCQALFGTNLDYVPNAQPSICKNNPDIGDTWYPAHKIFVEDKANIGGHDSWQIDTSTGNWKAPENYDEEKSKGYQKFTWKEDITKWQAQKEGETETSNWYQWNNSTKNWDAV
tara:strand:- start:2227 stop:2676 length:450 start_codon:yes stop_codon:yes gene_type:complete